MRKVITLVLAALFAIGAFAAPTGWKILKEIKIGGEGGWDYLTMDSSARRLYVSHATHVVVVDPDSGKVVGDIPDTPGVHGIALDFRPGTFLEYPSRKGADHHPMTHHALLQGVAHASR